MQIHKMLMDTPVYDDDDDNSEGDGDRNSKAPKTDYDKFRAFNANL